MHDDIIKFNNIESLSGSLLIASPTMTNNEFKKSIIFISEAKPSGVFGFVINGHCITDKKEKYPIYWGGPVNENKNFLMHSIDRLWPQSLQINDIAITNMRDIDNKTKMPKQCKIVTGYANWHLQQFEQEILAGLWLISPYNFDLIFSEKRDRWQYCLANLKINTNTYSKITGTA